MKDLTMILFEAVKEFGGYQTAGKDMKSPEVFQKKCVETTITSNQLTLPKIRDAFYSCGKILKEDFQNGLYIASIGSILRAAIIVARLSDEKCEIGAYAKEGLLNQHFAQKAVERFKNALGAYL